MKKFNLKTPHEIEIMAEGGAKLARVKNALKEKVAVGITAFDIEKLANELIKKEGAEASFKKVPGYSWATCISVNAGLVHGIPKPGMIFKKGDLVSIDVGIYYKGFHTDTSITVGIDLDPQTQKFLDTGREALKKSIAQVKVGKHIWDISGAMEEVIEGGGYSAIRSLVGHGVGRELHEEPQIPCFVPGDIQESPKIVPGMVLAVEVMYALGSNKTEVLEDGWTIAMADGKISALFEETVAVTDKGPRVLTA
jgi:methionyl aminopeptidase